MLSKGTIATGVMSRVVTTSPLQVKESDLITRSEVTVAFDSLAVVVKAIYGHRI